ncbi:hypothetical protein GpartN1_g2758.t1 [Galdieria partita]|uniref:Single-stranded DNA-binding protein n=1 Tax=Galdieria partita TaxID=83374 RepID=A0A9C7PVY8_9RHOD|nr:hypothetical protein GpartN1_g2758.t1 [Galdieria partita]
MFRYYKRLFPSRGFSYHSFENSRFQQEWKTPSNEERPGSTIESANSKDGLPYSYDTKWLGGNLNRVILIGYVGQDPMTKSVSSSTIVWNFPLSTTYKKRTVEGGEQIITDWHNISVYASPAAQFLERMIQKGNQLFLQGSIHTNTYVDQLGVKRKRCEIAVSMEGKGDLRLLSRAKRNERFQKETILQRNEKDERPLPDFQPMKREK